MLLDWKPMLWGSFWCFTFLTNNYDALKKNIFGRTGNQSRNWYSVSDENNYFKIYNKLQMIVSTCSSLSVRNSDYLFIQYFKFILKSFRISFNNSDNYFHRICSHVWSETSGTFYDHLRGPSAHSPPTFGLEQAGSQLPCHGRHGCLWSHNPGK